MPAKNDKVCEHCLERRGEHYFADNFKLSCAPRIDDPDSPYFKWNGLYATKSSRDKNDPNRVFRRKRHDDINQ